MQASFHIQEVKEDGSNATWMLIFDVNNNSNTQLDNMTAGYRYPVWWFDFFVLTQHSQNDSAGFVGQKNCTLMGQNDKHS